MEKDISFEEPAPSGALYKPLSARIGYLMEHEAYISLLTIEELLEYEIDVEDCNSTGGDTIDNAEAEQKVSNGDTIRNALKVGKAPKPAERKEPPVHYMWETLECQVAEDSCLAVPGEMEPLAA